MSEEKKATVRDLIAQGRVKNTSRARRLADAERTKELLDAGYGSTIERTSIRWVGARTKGKDFSRCQLVDTIEMRGGTALVMSHPTRGKKHIRRATPALLDVFFPSLPDNLRNHMLGRHA